MVPVTVTDCPVRFESGVRRTRSSVPAPKAHGPTRPPSETQEKQTPVVRPGAQHAEACARVQGTEPSWIPRGLFPPPPGSPPVTPVQRAPPARDPPSLPLVPHGNWGVKELAEGSQMLSVNLRRAL